MNEKSLSEVNNFLSVVVIEIKYSFTLTLLVLLWPSSFVCWWCHQEGKKLRTSVPDNTFQIKFCCLIKSFFTVRETSTVTFQSIRFSDCRWKHSSSQLAHLFSSFSACVTISERKNVCISQVNKLSSWTLLCQAHILYEVGKYDWIFAFTEIVFYLVWNKLWWIQSSC